jgi:hypothetical protein
MPADRKESINRAKENGDEQQRTCGDRQHVGGLGGRLS